MATAQGLRRADRDRLRRHDRRGRVRGRSPGLGDRSDDRRRRRRDVGRGRSRLLVPARPCRAVARSRPPASPGVGVSPTHRRRGILTRLMRWLLDQAAERGEPVVILHASEGPIYPRFGFGLATLQGTADIAKTDLRFLQPTEPIGRVRLVDRDAALELIPPIFDAKRLSSPGEVNRTLARWRAGPLADGGFHGRFGAKYRAVLEVDGVPARLRDLPAQARMGRARRTARGHCLGRRRARRRRRARALGMDRRHRPRAARSSCGARPSRIRCSSS